MNLYVQLKNNSRELINYIVAALLPACRYHGGEGADCCAELNISKCLAAVAVACRGCTMAETRRMLQH